MINLPDLADRLNQYGIMNKSFLSMTKTEIQLLINAVLSCPDETVPPDGWDKPRIEDGALILTFNSHPKYHWWTPDGQSIYETLIEIDAPYEVARQYLCSKQITEEVYLNKLIPF
jgi:hypothetical protein